MKAFCLFLLVGGVLSADEGMWLPDRFPTAEVAKRHGFTASPGFLRHLRESALRLSSGGTGSFVSPDGLIFTNHHVAADCIQKVSTAQADYMKNGFSAATRDKEIACPDLEAEILVQIDDVTSKVNEGIGAQTPAAEANRMRKAKQSAIEKQCKDATGRECQVVTLFSGGQYHLYQYKKYSDIRLVFAPEFRIAFFGGDPDNFEYPRYCLDITFFRAYENGAPARTPNYFRWARKAVKEGDLIFTSGNPGSTGRLATYAELEFYRDHSYPLVHRFLASLIRDLETYSAQGDENRRVAQDNLFGQSNSWKAYDGFLSGLRDPKLMAKRKADEQALRAAIAKDPARREEFGKFWDEVATAWGEYARFYKEHALLERLATRGSPLLAFARHLVRMQEESARPNGERLREYSDSARAALEQQLFSPALLTPSLEVATVANYLTQLQAELGANHAVVQDVLGGRTPRAAAEAYVTGSKLFEPEARKALAAGGTAASKDGMLELARKLDAPARAARKRYEDKIESITNTSAARIARARFDLSGGNEYPDATFTLRFAFGPVRGYTDAKGKKVPYTTTMEGAFKRATGKDPYILPESWLKAQPALARKAPFNFVATADTHGGNSGSATLNTKGEVVGILFDGNMESLPRRFQYADDRARSVHVDAQGILEALRKVYSAEFVISELEAARRR